MWFQLYSFAVSVPSIWNAAGEDHKFHRLVPLSIQGQEHQLGPQHSQRVAFLVSTFFSPQQQLYQISISLSNGYYSVFGLNVAHFFTGKVEAMRSELPQLLATKPPHSPPSESTFSSCHNVKGFLSLTRLFLSIHISKSHVYIPFQGLHALISLFCITNFFRSPFPSAFKYAQIFKK